MAGPVHNLRNQFWTGILRSDLADKSSVFMWNRAFTNRFSGTNFKPLSADAIAARVIRAPFPYMRAITNA